MLNWESALAVSEDTERRCRESTMEMVFLGIIVYVLYFITKNFWWILLAGISVIVLSNYFEKRELRSIESAIKVELIKEVAVYKKEAINTGYSIGKYITRHYRYKEYLDHYQCYFKVVFSNGSTKTIKCKKDSEMYRTLIEKCK